jgi:uncharacterized protein YndB with AHSA1/START domain
MAPLTNTIEIDRGPDEVFAYTSDPLRFAAWQADVVSVRVEGEGPPTVGSRFTTTRRIGRAQRTMTQQITEIDPPRRWAAHGVEGPIRPDASILIESLEDGSRSRVTFKLDFEGHGIGVALVPVVRQIAAKGAPRSHHRLKELLEARS